MTTIPFIMPVGVQQVCRRNISLIRQEAMDAGRVEADKERLNGRIWFGSEENKGTFYIRIPLKHNAAVKT